MTGAMRLTPLTGWPSGSNTRRAYAYTAPVSQSWQVARLTPRELAWQTLRSHRLQIDPRPDERHEAVDGFGNTVHHFGLHTAHRILRVAMSCEVEVAARAAAWLGCR